MQLADPVEAVVVHEPYALKGARTVLRGGYSRNTMSLPSKDTPKTAWNPRRLDVRAFAQAAASLQDEEPLSAFPRVQAEAALDDGATLTPVRWRAQGEMRPAASGGTPDVWLHLQADARVPLICQRCLAPVDTPLTVDRWFRFVADEATAEAQDDDCEEDLLALEPKPDLHDVLEDELLMELPLVPMHDTCPEPVSLRTAGAGDAPEAAAPRKNPFAELAKLKK
jgi:uncharacterized protein